MKFLGLLVGLVFFATTSIALAATGEICGRITKISVSQQNGDSITIAGSSGGSTSLALINYAEGLSVAQTAFLGASKTCVDWTDNNGLDSKYITAISMQ
jgi:hypothetical protein